VVILHEQDVELPSDIHGVLYVPLDSQGAWRNAVARELQAAGLEVDLTALLR
jgi:predicted nucleotide-binding protein